MSQPFYVTTTLPYVNAEPHIGFAMEILGADVIARHQRLLGNEVTFNTGTDEHGQKIYQTAQKNNQDPQTYCDEYAVKFKQLQELLNLNYTHFIRTTDPHHRQAAQAFWERSLANGDIYLAEYQTKYCVGCELEKTESELVNGRCPLHPAQELETRQEQNYFFRFSKYQQPLLKFYQANPKFVEPSSKMREIISFVEQGLKDFSISRLKSKMPWGVPVPNDPEHVMYVWFDALTNYISTLGWPSEQANFTKFWPGVQLAGKDNLRQQAAMWQAMLLSANLPHSQKILINGFISVGGQKMSKSLGNVISPVEMVQRYGIDGTRYLILSLGLFGDDIDVTWERFNQSYEADLANALGNLCSRVAKMMANEGLSFHSEPVSLDQNYLKLMANYQLSQALAWIIEQVNATDLFLSQTQPWKLQGDQKHEILLQAASKIVSIAHHLQSFLPSTASNIQQHFQGKIEPLAPLFPRIN